MDNFSHIGKTYIERAEKLKVKTNYIGSFLLIMILMSWLSNEYLFKEVKYDSIVIYQKYKKLEILRSSISRGNNNSKADSSISELKRKLDSTSFDKNNPEVFAVIEEVLPNPFPYILSQNIKFPFGLLFSSMTILIFVTYFSYSRKMLLKFSSLGLRIILKEEKETLNPYNEYGLRLPFWVFPIDNLKFEEIKIKDLTKIGSSQKTTNLNNIYTTSCHFILLLMQLRLFYFSYIINDYFRNWILIVQIIGVGVHVILIIQWFSRFHVQNFLKTEDHQASLNRRISLIYLGVIIVYLFLGFKFINKRSELISTFLNPRKRKHKGGAESKLCFILETKALELVENEGVESAYKYIRNQIFKYVVDSRNQELAVSFSRLFDLQLRLIHQVPDKSRKNGLILESVRLGKSTNSERITSKMKNWEEKYLS